MDRRKRNWRIVKGVVIGGVMAFSAVFYFMRESLIAPQAKQVVLVGNGTAPLLALLALREQTGFYAPEKNESWLLDVVDARSGKRLRRETLLRSRHHSALDYPWIAAAPGGALWSFMPGERRLELRAGPTLALVADMTKLVALAPQLRAGIHRAGIDARGYAKVETRGGAIVYLAAQPLRVASAAAPGTLTRGARPRRRGVRFFNDLAMAIGLADGKVRWRHTL